MAASDWRQIKDDREKYKAYLCSREWALLRNAVRARCGGKCERCGVNDMECVHHLTYARKYDERIEDLAGWCNACHDFTHGKSDADPKPQQRLVDAVREEFGEATRNRFIDLADSWFACVQRKHGEKSWLRMIHAMVCGIMASEQMGIEWLARAADGEFKSRHGDIELDKLIRKRRKEQGIE
jgi:hypothetical protein